MRVVLPYQNQEWAEVLRIAREWHQQEPENADASYYLGRAEYALNRPAEATRHLSAAVALNPRLLDAQVVLARLAIDAGDRGRAEKILDVVTSLNADAAEILSKQIE